MENWMIGDLHIHSRFARGCSSNITIPELAKWAKIKGICLLGTGDFTHPEWLAEIRELLVEKNGFYYYQDFPFLITGEISLIYSQEGKDGKKGRRVHLVVLVPNLEIADKINAYLDTKGRRDYDGRPIFNISCEGFVGDLKSISELIEIIPAHIWTPWFSLFGSKSGFDSLKEAFGSQADKVYAIETGMSSDPAMNWRIEELQEKSIVSFSDAHSFWPFRLGREATIFKKTDSYEEIVRQIRENDFIATIETDPAYGKYHWDGHRNCGVSFSPQKTQEAGGICPVCERPLTIGVENRVLDLASQEVGFKPKGAKPYYVLLPLHEIISLRYGLGMQSKGVWKIYNQLIKEFGNEFNVLLKVSKDELARNTDEKLIELILKNREGKIRVKPGFDGEYGKAELGEMQATL